MSDRKEIRKEVREISRAQPRHVAKKLSNAQYEELDDKYYYDRTLQPDDMVYEWKRYSVLGKEDRQYMAKMMRYGWKAVPGSRHPETGGQGDEPIIIDGQILMERDAVSVEMAREKTLRDSVQGQQDHFRRLKLETPAQALKLGRTYESQPIPE